LRILFAFKLERLLKGPDPETARFIPALQKIFLDRTPLSHGSFLRAFLSAGGDLERAATSTQLSLIAKPVGGGRQSGAFGLKQRSSRNKTQRCAISSLEAVLLSGRSTMSEFDQEDGHKKWFANPDFNPAQCNVVATEHRASRTTAGNHFIAST
jgi:hypothetical protein